MYLDGKLLDDTYTIIARRSTPLCMQEDTSTIYLCPGTQVCTSDYSYCNNVNEEDCNSSAPYKCFVDSEDCVNDVDAECCTDPEKAHYCPYDQTCVSSEGECCQRNPDTPVACRDLDTGEVTHCAAFEYECCSSFESNGNPLVKCTFEDKCVPVDSRDYCFEPFDRDCQDSHFPYLCKNDGRCRRNAAECASPKVCPPGYFQCPDNTCLPGSDQHSSCEELTDCKQLLPGTNAV